MKRCPHCGRDYDLTMNFCLDDGSELLYCPTPGGDTEHAFDRSVRYGLNEAKTEVLNVGHQLVEFPATKISVAYEGFWIAVMPFRFQTGNHEMESLAEGLAEEIVTGLSRFSYIRVIARGSASRFSSPSIDIRTVGRELGARYLMAGSLRQSGQLLRVAVQVYDAATGEHLWAETYERRFDPTKIFEVQDDLVPRIVSTVADWYGVLPKSMSESIRAKSPESFTPYEALLYFFGYNLRVTEVDHLTARVGLEQALIADPADADCWAMLANVYLDEYKFGYNPEPEPLERALNAASRAVELVPSNPSANCQLAHVRFFRREIAAFREAAERAIELNPLDGAIVGYMGVLIACSGDWDRGCELAGKAIELNPKHPGWFWGPFLNRAYLVEKDYQKALSYALKPNLPGFFYFHLNLAAIYGQLGEEELAGRALLRLIELKPDIAATVRNDVGMWLDPDSVEAWIVGLRKAGLAVPDIRK